MTRVAPRKEVSSDPPVHIVQDAAPYNSIHLQARLWEQAWRGGPPSGSRVHGTGWVPSRADLVLYHYGSFALSAFRYAVRPRTIFVFHNVTPARLLLPWSPLVALRAAAADLQLRLLPRRLPWIGVSPYNCGVLAGYGFQRIEHVPVVVEPRAPQPKSEAPVLLFVGRISPNKNVIRLLRMHRELSQALSPRPRLIIVGQRKPRCPYGQAFEKELERMAGQCDVVWLREPVRYRYLLDLHGKAWLYVSMSLHEGCGVPVCESVACHTPAIYLQCGGTESVLAGHGMVPLCEHRNFSSYVLEALASEQLRQELLVRQQLCIEPLQPAAVRERLLSAVSALATDS